MVTNEIYEKEKDNRLMIDILANIVEFRNGESGLHVVHIRMLTELLLKDLIEKTDRYPISKADIPLISNASALHDIGKITIPESILNKPGKLTQEEFEVMKSHSIEGAKLLSPEPPGDDAEPLIKTAYQICRWHHERYDGRGYPDGLRGEEIPIVAQVVALADVYDALTSKRVYKDAYSHKRAVEMILRGECGAFNPLLLDCFVDVSDELKQCMEAGDHEAHTDEEIRNFAEDIKGREALDVSAQVFRQLEHEQQKNRFFANHSGAIQFDYSLAPEMLTLSSWGANYLGLPETILNPRQDTRWSEIFSKDQMLDLARKLRNTSTRDPLVEQACELFIDGQKREGKVVAQAMWTSDETPRYEGAVGEIRGI
jgi:putative two-component system response regulator